MHSTRQKHEMKISNMLYFSDISIFVWRTKHNSVDFGYGVSKKHVLFQEIFYFDRNQANCWKQNYFGGFLWALKAPSIYLENQAAGDNSWNEMFESQNFGPIRREWACSIGRKFVLKTEIFEIHTLNFVTQFDILPQTQVMSTILPKSNNLRALGDN